MKVDTGSRRVGLTASAMLLVAPLLFNTAAAPAVVRQPTPGAPGIGDSYFPRDGNGGYDVARYNLQLRYRPRINQLTGRAAITARATKTLSRFNLDFDGLRVRSVQVNGAPARWTRRRGELRIDPAGAGLLQGRQFRAVIRYSGVPKTLPDGSGFVHTDDGAMAVGQPHVASYWFPVNDHPVDRASFTFRITAPRRLEVVANGALHQHRIHGTTATWRWKTRAPMAPYLATINVGEFQLSKYRRDGIRYWDAIDPDLLAPVARPRTGDQFAFSGQATETYTRLTREIDVPAEGAQLDFWVRRVIESGFDFFFVEAREVGTDDWTTLPDRNGHTERGAGFACPGLVEQHPFLEHYLAVTDEGCSPRGSTGRWHAATGENDRYERWRIDLSDYAGRRIEISLAYVTDPLVTGQGVFVDDVTVSTGQGTTSFEDDEEPLDGWVVEGPPAGSPDAGSAWRAGTVSQIPAPFGRVAAEAFAKQPEIIGFLSRRFGPYPFRVAGGILDDHALGFALETQTRPVYDKWFFDTDLSAELVLVHELAHQWYGDSVVLRRWRHIWLNEGFATYAEWLWRAREGTASLRQSFYDVFSIPANDPFWKLKIGNPGPDAMFDAAVYARGAMALYRLRTRVGERDFARILHRWAQRNAGETVTTREFIELAEKISGRSLDRLFRTWLFTPRKPRLVAPPPNRTSHFDGTGAAAHIPRTARHAPRALP